MENFETIKITDNVIHVRKHKKSGVVSKELSIDDECLIGIITSIKDLLESLISNSGDWKITDNINMIITQSTITNNEGGFSIGLIDNSNILMANTILWNEESISEFTELRENLSNDIWYSFLAK